MKISVLNSKSISCELWKSYVEGFNSVFEKDFSIDFLQNKYANTCDNISWHSLYIDEEKNIVAGSCSAQPACFIFNNKEIKVAILVDVFIRQDYREDPFALSKIYKALRKILISEGISIVLAVPNKTAYSYWKNIVRLKDVGDLDFWILPLKIGSILKKNKILNIFSNFFCKSAILTSKLIASISDKVKPTYKYSPIIDADFLSKRLPSNIYKHIEVKGYEYFYKIENEDGVKAAYLFYSTKNKVFAHSALSFAVGEISKIEKPDIVFYIGKIGFMQTSLFKVPKKFEPKRLPLVFDVICDSENFSDVDDINNWDFGLINYDVR